MKKLFRAIALVLTFVMLGILLGGCATTPTVDKIKEDGKLVMLTNAAFPPYEYTSGGEVAGIDVDIAKEIAADLGVKLEIQDMPFEGIINAIKSGKGSFGAAGMSITEDRKKNVDFSIEYAQSKLFVLVTDTETEIKTPDDLNDMTIGVQTGTTSDTYATDVEGAQISRYGNFLDAAQALKSGKVRAVVVDELTSNEILAANPELVRLDEPLADEGYAICVQKGNTTLLDAINATLTRLIESGKIQEFMDNNVTGLAESSEEPVG
ncbi:MAG: transporter substrate-binding domain-containing protein [Eubacteriales bacterium]|jgi:ABC-type amino acid transport substrate-binding protein|nr:transporter substrate-binding domain-containing protein [Eubacteriales bacterium]